MEANIDYSYVEPTLALGTRIEMHKKFSTFSLEEYLSDNYNFVGKSVLDMGAGDGNLSHTLAKGSELYFGVEKNVDSLAKAHERYRNCPNMLFVNEDMDNSLYLPSNRFDYIFFIYSSYYTNNAEKLFSEMYRSLKPGASLILIGPSTNNAWEVDDFCSVLFGATKASSLRSSRIIDEFSGVLDRVGFDVSVDHLNFNLEFDSSENYFLYIKSTLQYRETFKDNVIKPSSIENLLIDKYNLTLTKEVVSLCAKK